MSLNLFLFAGADTGTGAAGGYNPMNMVLSGAIFLIILILIMREKIHRTLTAMLGAVAIGLLGIWFNFYSTEQAVHAVDLSTIGLLFGMMVMVILLNKTGFFEFAAIYTAQMTKGRPILLMIFLGFLTSFLSMFLDNVTTVVLIAPVTLLIAEVIGMNPVPFLLGEAMLSNIGGTATLIGDPPNIMIAAANPKFHFLSFITTLGPITALAWIFGLAFLIFAFRKVFRLKPRKLEALQKIKPREALTDPVNAKKVLIVLAVVLVLFCFHHTIQLQPSLIALFGAALSLLLTKADLDDVFKRVEWAVLIFFACLFVVVGGLEHAGVLSLLSEKMVALAKIDVKLAGLVILWGSALLSAVVDNVPYTMAMIPVLSDIQREIGNANALWWALALGAGLGGNGTPIGSTAGIIVIALSEKTRSRITFKMWLKVGIAVTVITCLVATAFVLFAYNWLNR
ncbi:MAG: ArsB/NhaD family transporter [Chloroflexi bacterium]|nr:ArsB/NhaD family transporter [Chloroflexota bacterium]